MYLYRKKTENQGRSIKTCFLTGIEIFPGTITKSRQLAQPLRQVGFFLLTNKLWKGLSRMQLPCHAYFVSMCHVACSEVM